MPPRLFCHRHHRRQRARRLIADFNAFARVRRSANGKPQSFGQKLSAVETLGATTIILTDKTGTLTENEMTVREIWLDNQNFPVSGNGYEPVGEIKLKTENQNEPVKNLLRAAALCCDAHLVAPSAENPRWTAIGDPTEAAILVAAEKTGLSRAILKSYERLAELPFDSVRKRMSTIQRIDGKSVACVKGALNEMLRFCPRIRWQGKDISLNENHRQKLQEAHNNLAHKGLRVLAVALREIDSTEKRQTANGEHPILNAD